MTARI